MATVLIVDDDPNITDLFQIFLTNDGHKAITASNGEKCFEMLRKYKPDVILLDIMMEPMDGWEILSKIKENPNTSSIPVVMVTGKPLEEQDCEIYGNLFYDYLMKPIRRAQICEVVRCILNQK